MEKNNFKHNSKKTLVLGASTNPARYSFLAITNLRNKGYEVVAIGRKGGKVTDIQIEVAPIPITGLHTITLYLNAENQKPYYHYILEQNPARIIFNPGAENPELATLARERGIQVMNACTLVMLSTGQF